MEKILHSFMATVPQTFTLAASHRFSAQKTPFIPPDPTALLVRPPTFQQSLPPLLFLQIPL